MQHLQVYHTDVKRLPLFSTLAPEVHSQGIDKKNNPLAPRGTSFMNLKEAVESLLLSGIHKKFAREYPRGRLT